MGSLREKYGPYMWPYIGLFRVHICGFSHFFSINYSLLINGVHFQLDRCVNWRSFVNVNLTPDQIILPWVIIYDSHIETVKYRNGRFMSKNIILLDNLVWWSWSSGWSFPFLCSGQLHLIKKLWNSRKFITTEFKFDGDLVLKCHILRQPHASYHVQ